LPTNVLLVIIATFSIILVGFSLYSTDLIATNVTKNKVVIINFDDGRKTQFTSAKQILDKYGFKATFYIVCNYVDNKKGFMTWEEIQILKKEGHDIGSHSMNHIHLSNLSNDDIEYEVGESKKCIGDHGIAVSSFAYPFNDGSNNERVFKIVSKYYQLARVGNNPISYLNCDGLKVPSFQRDCKAYANMHHLIYSNKFTIGGWSHDFSRMVNSYSDEKQFKRFTEVVNSQDNFNEGGLINGIPIIIYHRLGEPDVIDYNTDLKLFKKEMKYLYDNGFTVLTMADLAYNEESNHIVINQFDEPEISKMMAGYIPN
jgi:peptidoglycan/xylan/chitin deacetylase (PgdA/CDA1 family)